MEDKLILTLEDPVVRFLISASDVEGKICNCEYCCNVLKPLSLYTIYNNGLKYTSIPHKHNHFWVEKIK